MAKVVGDPRLLSIILWAILAGTSAAARLIYGNQTRSVLLLAEVETKKRVFIVDDEPNIGRIFGLKLKLAGYDVMSTTSGAEAIEIVRTQKFDVMLLDILMPDVTGMEVLEKVRAFSQIPILISSAKQDVVDIAKSMGANGSVSKPLNPDHLVEQIRGILGEKNNQKN